MKKAHICAYDPAIAVDEVALVVFQSPREGMGESRAKKTIGLLPGTLQRRRQLRVDPVRLFVWSGFFTTVVLVWIVIGWVIVRQF